MCNILIYYVNAMQPPIVHTLVYVMLLMDQGLTIEFDSSTFWIPYTFS